MIETLAFCSSHAGKRHYAGRVPLTCSPHLMKASLPVSSIEPLESRIAPAFLPTFDLANVDGHNGFKISGVLSSYSGMSDAGDVNGDGFADIIVGAAYAGGHGYVHREIGVSYVV